jgi:hypothetical protein
MNEDKKVVAVPIVPGPVVSQAMPAAAEPGAGLAPMPPDAPVELSQVEGFKGILPRVKAVASHLR